MNYTVLQASLFFGSWSPRTPALTKWPIPVQRDAMKLCFATFQTISLLFLGLFAFASTPNQLTEEEKAAGWKLLFNGNNVEGWRSFKKPSPPGKGWEVEDSWLHCLGKSGGDIITDKEFTDFELEWEWKLSPKGNSGVKYFVTETRDSALGHEYQMIDEEG